MPTKLAERDQFTIEAYLEFAEGRPEGERWELIEGVPVVSPSPSPVHQVISGNVYMLLGQAKIQSGATWVPSLGIGTIVPISPRSLPQPDVMVYESPRVMESASPLTDDVLVLFEVLSKSNTKADQAWRRKVYASVPNCRHYIAIDASKVAAVRYDRDIGWARAADLDALTDTLELPALGTRFPLSDIYRWTPLGV